MEWRYTGALRWALLPALALITAVRNLLNRLSQAIFRCAIRQTASVRPLVPELVLQCLRLCRCLTMMWLQVEPLCGAAAMP